MKKTILIALIVLLFAMPCRAQDNFSLNGTEWLGYILGLSRTLYLNIGFYNKFVYIKCDPEYGDWYWRENGEYIELPIISFFECSTVCNETPDLNGLLIPFLNTGYGSLSFHIFIRFDIPMSYIKVSDSWSPE